MDKHYLTPLFAPASVAVLAGRRDDAVGRTALGKAVSEALRAQRYAGRLQFVDIHTTGTLADLAQTRATWRSSRSRQPRLPARSRSPGA